MYVKEVQVQNQVGLHARPATFCIQKANEYKSSVWVEKEERRVNAKRDVYKRQGLESVLSGEIKRMGGEEISVTDGKVAFEGGEDLLARARCVSETGDGLW